MVTNGETSTITVPELTSLPAGESRFAIVNTDDEPVFSYFNGDNDRLETDGSVPAPTFRKLPPKVVQVHLRMVGETGDLINPISLVTTVALRNSNRVFGC